MKQSHFTVFPALVAAALAVPASWAAPTPAQQAYVKASNTGSNDNFGYSVSLSGDTMVIGAPFEDSGAAGVNGNQSDNSASDSGAAYVFVRSGSSWSQQAYLKASNTGAVDSFGTSVAVSGETLAVGAYHEASSATGVNGSQGDNRASGAGAAYVFGRTGTNWTQQTYLKASNTGAFDNFGQSVAVSGDTVVVGAYGEDSGATGVNGNQSNNSVIDSGAAYVFTGFCPSCPLLALVPDDSDGYFIRFNGASAVTYLLQRASNVTGPWDTIAMPIAPASGFIEYHETTPPPSAAFYRTVTP